MHTLSIHRSPWLQRRRLLGRALGMSLGTSLLSARAATTHAMTPVPTSGAAPTPAPQAGVPPALRPLTLDTALGPVRAWWGDPDERASGAAGGPALMLLHGSGERGEVLDDVLRNGLGPLARQALSRGWRVCLPQLPAQQSWSPDRLHALLPVLQMRSRGPLRWAVLGLSLGGRGAWEWAASHPDDLSAAVSVCGWAEPATACAAAAVPMRAYHGALDDVVPLARQQAAVDALRQCGGRMDFTVYPQVRHDAWGPALQDPQLWPWLTHTLSSHLTVQGGAR